VSEASPDFEQFIHTSPPPLSEEVKTTLEEKGNRDNVVAFDIQWRLHQLLNDPENGFDQLTHNRLRRIQSMAFEAYFPPLKDLEELLQGLESQTTEIVPKVQRFVAKTREKIEMQLSHWKATGYEGELLQVHQDIDAVALFADKLGGRYVVFGSARKGPGTPEYNATCWLMQTLVEGLPHDDGTVEQVVTGAGPGISKRSVSGA